MDYVMLKNLMIKHLGDITNLEELEYLFINDPEKLYQYSPIAKSKGFTHLHKCVLLTNKYPAMNNYLEEYLKICDNINQVTDLGMSALHLSCQNSKNWSSERTIELLIEHGININLQCNMGWSALHDAVTFCQYTSTEKTIETLINAGINVNLQSNQMMTALFYAVSYLDIHNSTKIIIMIINAKANVNLQRRDGDSVLHSLIKHKYKYDIENVAELLINAGADMNLRNNNNKTPFDYCTLTFKKQYEKIYQKYILIKLESKELFDDECIVCYDTTKVYKCKYNHGTCQECLLIQSETRCLICKENY